MADENKQKKELTITIKTPELVVLGIFCILTLALYLNVTLKSPIVFGDEGFHTRMAQLIAQEKNYFIYLPFESTPLLANTFSRPPLWNLLEAGFFMMLGFSEILVKFLTPFIAVATGLAVYTLVKRLLDGKIALLSAIVMLAVPSFVTYSVLFYSDIFLSFYMAMFILTFAMASKLNSRKYLALAATFAALVFLTKTSGLMVVVFLAMAFLYELLAERKLRITLKKYSVVMMVFLIIVAGFLIRNIAHYGTLDCAMPIGIIDVATAKCAGIKNYSSSYAFSDRALQTGTEQTPFSLGIANYFVFAYGNLWFLVLGSVAGYFLLFWKRDKFINFILIFAIMLPMVFPFVAQRAEDTARHTLIWVFALSIIASSFFAEIYGAIRKYNRYVALAVFIIVILLSYQSLVDKLNGMKSVKQFSPLFLQACDWVEHNLPENATLYSVWDHNAIYNCQRNVVAQGSIPDIALSNNVDIIKTAAGKNDIDYIFIQKFSIDTQNRNIASMYNLDFVSILENDNTTFTKVYENGPDVQQCLQQGGCDGSIIYRINLA